MKQIVIIITNLFQNKYVIESASSVQSFTRIHNT